MKTTPQAAFISINRNLGRIVRTGSMIELRRYVESPAYAEAMGRLLGTPKLVKVLALYVKAYKKCDVPAPLLGPGTVKRAKWDATLIAKYRNAWAKTGSFEGAARMCGITLGASKLAHRRYVVAATTADRRLAA